MTEHAELALQLLEARSETDRLFTHLDPAALYDRPIAERHRMIFYLGHLEAFDWNQMKQLGMTAASPTPEFDDLFAFGIDPEPGRLPHDSKSDWPSLSQVSEYNRGVRDTIDQNLKSAPDDVVQMMVEHRHMHAETFTYILHNLEGGKKHGPEEHLPEVAPTDPRLIIVPAGTATLGKPVGAGFGWDNEFGEIQVPVPEFAITKYKITNGEWLDYMRQTGATAPHYWRQKEGEWFFRGVFHEFPLPLNWPVYVTWDQASAYSKFRQLELPSEPQFHRSAYGTPNAGELANLDTPGNFGYRRWDPVPVNAYPETESPWGVAQLVGNGWEWTSTVFAPFPGFTPRSTYPGYSANFFDHAHYVLKGASPRTADLLVRRSLRNWFRPEYPYVYATFHLVRTN